MLGRLSQCCHPSIECCHWVYWCLFVIKDLQSPNSSPAPVLGVMYKYTCLVQFFTTECNTKFCINYCVAFSPITYLSMCTLGTGEHWCQDCCSGVQPEVYGLWVCLQVTFQGNKDRLAVDFFSLAFISPWSCFSLWLF